MAGDAAGDALGEAATVTVTVHRRFAEVAGAGFSHVAVDMPIGLPEQEPRACDREARARLGPRRSSIFPAPPRAALPCADHAAAVTVSRAATGRGLSRQAFLLIPKIAEVDTVVRRLGQHRITEAAPECAFAALAGAPLPHGKRTSEGIAARRTLVASALPEVAALLETPPRGARLDDVLDAAALAWTARRLLRGEAVRLGDGRRDGVGLVMEIAY